MKKLFFKMLFKTNKVKILVDCRLILFNDTRYFTRSTLPVSQAECNNV